MSDQTTATPLSELARAALLGAERESVPMPSPDSPLAPFMAQLGELEPEYQLLSLAGVSGLYQQAGSLPVRIVSQPYQDPTAADPAPAPEPDPTLAPTLDPINEQSTSSDTENESALVGQAQPDGPPRATCSSAAGLVLVSLLDGTHRNLLPEFLRMLAAADLMVPAEYLPNILSYGTNQSALRSVILAVTGAKGQELAARNPKWVYVSPHQLSWDVALSRWRVIKTSAGRQNFLRQLRGHNPELGRRLLETTWKSEESSARVSLLRGLESRLSMADEPFLEAALDDRNNSVRKKAVDLLSTMPQSRLCQRMAKNTESLLAWVEEESEQKESKQEERKQEKGEESGATKRAKIEVRFPEELSAELQRDGVIKRNIKDDSRRRRMELLDMVTPVPLESWTDRWQSTPAEIVQAVQKSRWPRTLTQALVQATERQKNLEWVDALLTHADFKLPVTKLISLLSPAKFDALVKRLDPGVDADNRLTKSHPLVTAVRRWNPGWSDDLSRRWMDRLEAQMPLDAETTNLDSLVRTATKQFARACAPALIDESITRLEALQTSAPDIWQPTIEQSLATLRMRNKMKNVVVD